MEQSPTQQKFRDKFKTIINEQHKCFGVFKNMATTANLKVRNKDRNAFPRTYGAELVFAIVSCCLSVVLV